MELLVKHAKLMHDPEQLVDIRINQGHISDIGTGLQVVSESLLDLDGTAYLSPGWIDCHVHAYEAMTLYGDKPDIIGVDTGVTSLIDAGSCGADNIGAFAQLSKQAQTQVYALLNISRMGLVAQNELSDMANIDLDLVAQAVAHHPEFIVGLKARMSKTVVGENGLAPLHHAIQASERHQLPLMVHIGSEPPLLSEVFACLQAGHMVTHCFNGKPNGIVDQQTGQLKPFVKPTLERGVGFDIGHGTDSFNFETARLAFQAGVQADTISTDIYRRNRTQGPVYDLATTMAKLHHVGYSWTHILHKVTAAPAKWFGLTNKGYLQPGYAGDLTVFQLKKEPKALTDAQGERCYATEYLVPQYAIVKGKVHECS